MLYTFPRITPSLSLCAVAVLLPPPPHTHARCDALAHAHVQDGCTALWLACVNKHEGAAAELIEATKLAGALDNVVGDDGFSALLWAELWAEEHGLDSVAQRLRECGAAAVHRPALSLFRGKPAEVQIKVAERTVAFRGSFVTVRSMQQCPRGGKGYYELEILESDDKYPQYGFAAPAFERMLGSSSDG